MRLGPAARALRLPSAKPVDVGNGRLVASFAATRPQLLSLTFYQPEYGVAELTGMPPFDERVRGMPDEVRRYRTKMASDDFPCLWLEGTVNADVAVVADVADTSDLKRPAWAAAEAWAEVEAIVIAWRVTADEAPMRLRFRGRLDRPALAEITELDPPAPTGATTTLAADSSRLLVGSTMPATVAIDSNTGEWVIDGDADASLEATATEVVVRITVLDDLPRGRKRASGPPAVDIGVPADVARIVDRAIAYTRSCAALNTATDEVAILADHRLLPLSWTRDGYYQALLLLATGVPADAGLVAEHLRWLWRRCQHPDGRWLRSHHANGSPKDSAFQADQQLYPMLELADYWRMRGSVPDGSAWTQEIERAWAATVAEIDHRTGLMATVENAADDPSAAPFVASSQILLWYTALRLAEVADAGALDVDADELRGAAAAAREGFERHMVENDRWLYATDARATRVRYHDANDLPVALAPLLGFCSADDRGWRGTMEFAFSEANPGFFAGERGGLGSAHTPAAWTLGDVQAWIRARISGDAAGMAAAQRRLVEVAFHDGMLPEAYSTTLEPDVRIRHWFAWPGAAFGAMLLLDARDELTRLRPRLPEPPH